MARPAKKTKKPARKAAPKAKAEAKPLVKKVPADSGPAVYRDHNNHTCLKLFENEDTVKYLTLESEEEMVVQETSPTLFHARFSAKMDDYPVEKAAKVYVNHATLMGASQEAMSELASFTAITSKEIIMATKKTEDKKAATKKATPKKAATKKAAPKKEKAPKAAGERKPRESAAQMFKDLIMAGNFTDDTIFKKVQEKFGLDDSKRGYVAWYRNWLVKSGAKVPAAKTAK